MPLEDILRELSKKYLNEIGQVDVEIALQDGKLHIAQAYLLGAIDRGWKDGGITEAEAGDAYAKIGLALEESARLRTINIDKF